MSKTGEEEELELGVLDDEEIRYFVRPHKVRPDQKVVTIYVGRELIATFYMHSWQKRRFCVFMSNYIRDVYTDMDNPLAKGLVIDLGANVEGKEGVRIHGDKKPSRSVRR